MKKLYDGVQRFCAAHPRFGIPNLMRVIVIGNAAVYILSMLTMYTNPAALDFLKFNLNGLLHGEIWRIVTFIFYPSASSPLMLIISLYFYYWIGSTLEQQWGTAKFNLYYFSGMLLTVIGAILASLITGNSFISVAGTTYVNLSMFFAFAMLFPDTTVLFMFFLPVKMKWLAYLDGALFAFDIIRAIGQHNWAGVVLPVVAFITLRTRKWPDETAPLDPWLRRLIIWGSAFVIGGYDGYYGPGTGTFMMIALVRFAKLDTRHAAGGVKVVNLASNLGSLFTALRAGYVLVGVGLISSVASILGHYIGAGLAIKNGSKIVRPTVIAVLLLLTVKVGSELLFPEFWS